MDLVFFMVVYCIMLFFWDEKIIFRWLKLFDMVKEYVVFNGYIFVLYD